MTTDRDLLPVLDKRNETWLNLSRTQKMIRSTTTPTTETEVHTTVEKKVCNKFKAERDEVIKDIHDLLTIEQVQEQTIQDLANKLSETLVELEETKNHQNSDLCDNVRDDSVVAAGRSKTDYPMKMQTSFASASDVKMALDDVDDSSRVSNSSANKVQRGKDQKKMEDEDHPYSSCRLGGSNANFIGNTNCRQIDDTKSSFPAAADNTITIESFDNSTFSSLASLSASSNTESRSKASCAPPTKGSTISTSDTATVSSSCCVDTELSQSTFRVENSPIADSKSQGSTASSTTFVSSSFNNNNTTELLILSAAKRRVERDVIELKSRLREKDRFIQLILQERDELLNIIRNCSTDHPCKKNRFVNDHVFHESPIDSYDKPTHESDLYLHYVKDGKNEKEIVSTNNGCAPSRQRQQHRHKRMVSDSEFLTHVAKSDIFCDEVDDGDCQNDSFDGIDTSNMKRCKSFSNRRAVDIRNSNTRSSTQFGFRHQLRHVLLTSPTQSVRNLFGQNANRGNKKALVYNKAEEEQSMDNVGERMNDLSQPSDKRGSAEEQIKQKVDAGKGQHFGRDTKDDNLAADFHFNLSKVEDCVFPRDSSSNDKVTKGNSYKVWTCPN